MIDDLVALLVVNRCGRPVPRQIHGDGGIPASRPHPDPIREGGAASAVDKNDAGKGLALFRRSKREG